MGKTFYITTPLYYVNASPHIGHAYTNIAADCIARFERLKGRKVFFLTGTDEHGEKIQKAAQNAGLSPSEFADKVVVHFIELWKNLSISYDDFIRTTEDRHIKTVQSVLNKMRENKKLGKGKFLHWYCVPCETFWTKGDFLDPKKADKCPSCNRNIEEIEEETYDLTLHDQQGWLRDYINQHPDFIQPQIRRNEMLGLLQQLLPDYFCVTRPKSRVEWGIELPFDKYHVAYVWFDALINYISAIGYPNDLDKFRQHWPVDVHIIGKDILRHHAIYWPVMLHSIGLELPKTIFAHGWWLIGEEKISKSKGNIVDPSVIVEKYGQDPFRYFLLREIPFGFDGTYSEDALIGRLNNDLANDIGNLLNRTLTMVERYSEGKTPQPFIIGCAIDDEGLKTLALNLHKGLDVSFDGFNFQEALEKIITLANKANKYIETQAPWNLYRSKELKRLNTVLYNLLEVLRILTIALFPFIPHSAKQMWEQLGIDTELEDERFESLKKWGLMRPENRVRKGKPLFPRIE